MDSEALFVRFFLPLYPPQARTREGLTRARAEDANPGGNRLLLLHLDDAAHRFVANAPALLGQDLQLDRSDASVHRLGAALTLDRRELWASRGAAGSADNLLFNAVVHGAAYVGACVVRNHGGAWRVRRPLWESLVRLRSAAGEGDLAVFHWWLKSLSTGVLRAPVAPGARAGARAAGGATLADRYRAHVEVPCADPESMAVFVTKDRNLPRLVAPTYDRLHRYLRAHLPEVRDLGVDFPSPERFASFGLRWLDFLVVGAGRGVVLAGASPQGLHLFWLGAGGFEKSAFVAGDAIPEPIVRVERDRITATTSERGQARVREMFWWGP